MITFNEPPDELANLEYGETMLKTCCRQQGWSLKMCSGRSAPCQFLLSCKSTIACDHNYVTLVRYFVRFIKTWDYRP